MVSTKEHSKWQMWYFEKTRTGIAHNNSDKPQQVITVLSHNRNSKEKL